VGDAGRKVKIQNDEKGESLSRNKLGWGEVRHHRRKGIIVGTGGGQAPNCLERRGKDHLVEEVRGRRRRKKNTLREDQHSSIGGRLIEERNSKNPFHQRVKVKPT